MPAPVMLDPLKRIVLVVEDEAIVRLDLVGELEAHGYDVLEAAGADTATALLRSCPDLHAAIVGIGLNGKPTGSDLVRTMREARPDCTVIVASGQDFRTLGEFDQHVLVEPKPYDPGKIASLLDRGCRGA